MFILSKIPRSFNPLSLSVGLIASFAIVFYLKHIGLAWTWFILISVTINIGLAWLTDIILARIKKG